MKRLLSLLILSITVSLFAAFPKTAPFTLDHTKIRTLAQDITSERYPEANTALIDDVEYTAYAADGTSITWDDMAYKILTEKGKDSMKVLSIHYTASYGKAAFECLEILKPDGSVRVLPLDKLTREMTDTSQMNSNIYDPNNKIVSANVPELDCGDIVRYRVRREVFKSRCPNTFSDIYILESDELIVNYDIIIDGPESLPLKHIALRDPVADTVTSSTEHLADGQLRYRWTARNVPVMLPEPRMPSVLTVAQRLLVTTIDSWEDVSRWYWNLCQPHMTVTPEMKAKVNELTKGLTSRDDIILAIYKFVSQEIRYMGITIEDTAPGYEPHDVALTFNNRHGVCRDKAALLAAMLTAGGIQAYPVLIMAGDKKDQEIMNPFFNHAITAADDGKGGYILMDSTDENTKDIFPAYLADKSYLVAREKGDTLQTSPFSPAKDNMMTITTTADISEKGSISVTSHLRFTGINDNAYRGTFASASPDEKQDFIKRVVKAVTPGARLTSLTIKPDDMLDMTTPLHITFTFEADDVFVSNDAYAMMTLPSVSSRFGMANFILRSTDLEKRKYPLLTRYACGVQETMTVRVSPEYGKLIALPSYTPVNDDCIQWNRTVSQANTDGSFNVTTDFTINVIEFSPKQYVKLKENMKVLEDNGRQMMILQTPQAQIADRGLSVNDAELLESSSVFTLADAKTWTHTQTRRLKVLTYKGKKENAEMRFGYTPLTESVTVNYARVITKDKDGKEKILNVSEKEKNIMDASWVAQAPRYPEQKTLVVSLPGVEVGSIIETQITETVKSPRPFTLSRAFRLPNIPVRNASVVINAPSSLKLSTALFQNGILSDTFKTHQNNVTESFATENGRAIWTWHIQNQPALPDEPNTPPLSAFTPALLASAGNWSQNFNDLKEALLAKAVPGDRTRAIAADLQKIPQEKRLKAVNAFMDRAINAAGPHFLSLPLDRLSTADTTLTDGYGHRADRAIAVYAILKELGYTPEFILASSVVNSALFNARYSMPDMELFGTVLVRVRDNDSDYWFNSQNQYADLHSTGYEFCPAATLDGKVFTITVPDDHADQTLSEYHIQLKDDGSADVTFTSFIHSTDFGSSAKYYAELTPEFRRRNFQSLLQSVSRRAVPTSELVTDFNSYPGKLSFTCTIPQYAVVNGDFMYLKLPVESFKQLPLKLLDKRQLPFMHSARSKFVRKITITLPPSFSTVVMAPEDFSWNSPLPLAPADKASYHIGTDRKDNTLTVFYNAELRQEIVFPQDFPAYDALSRTLSREAANTLLLKRNPTSKNK